MAPSDRNVIPLEHIIQIPRQPVFAHTLRFEVKLVKFIAVFEFSHKPDGPGQ